MSPIPFTLRSLLVLGLLVGFACNKKSDSDSAPTPARKSIPEASAPAPQGLELAPAGPALAERAILPFAIYYLPTPKRDPLTELKKLIAKEYSFVSIASDVDSGTMPFVVVQEPDMADFAPPDVESLQYFGRGLSKAQVASVQESKQALLLIFNLPPKDRLQHHREVMELMLKLAKRTKGLLWDESTRELFSQEAWSEMLSSWDGVIPKSWTLFTIHSYRDGEFIRMVTLGMDKLGLPDLLVTGVSGGDALAMAGLMNLVAQTLLSGGEVGDTGGLKVNINVSPGAWELKDGAKGETSLTLAIGKAKAGDPENRLWEIVFPGPVSELQVRHQEALHELFGSNDSIVQSEHDDELEAASRRGRKELAKLKPLFQSFDTERLLVKAPFTTDDGGTEWMWVEVTSWKGDTLKGVLQNDPFSVRGLKAGAHVEAEFESLFDYIYYHADGSQTGNGTGAILQLRQDEGT